MKELLERRLDAENFTNNDFVSISKFVESKDNAKIAERIRPDRSVRLLHAAMGMQTETAEITDALKKSFFYGRELDDINLIEELGDVLWYVAIAIDELGTSFEHVMKINSRKLMHRYKGGFTEAQAENRDLDGERKILES